MEKLKEMKYTFPVSIKEERDETIDNTASSDSQSNLPLMDWEKGLVGWDSEEDPMNPLNWSAWKKRSLMFFMAVISTLSPLASSMVAPSITQTMQDLHEPSKIIGTFMVTIYLLGFALGPLALGPCSEIWGRYPVVILATWFLNLWILGSALAPSMAGLIVMRLLAGVGGSAVMTIAPAIMADMFPVSRRAFATAVITLAQCVGPALGPLCGSFISEELGWRWDYWILLIATGTVTALMTLFMPETYAPVMLQRKAKRLRKQTGRIDMQPLLSRPMSTKDLLATSMIRPLKLLTRSPIVFLMCSYVAMIYGILYLWFTTIPTVFEETYGWPSNLTGLAYLGLGIGMVISLLTIMRTNDATVMKLTAQNNGIYEPEMRLPASIYYAVFVPISLFWYGWSTEKKAHWIVPVIGMAPFGFGMLGIFVPVQQYLVDAFSTYSASAVAAVRTSLSIVGTFLPLAGPPLYRALGLGMGNTVLGIIALVMTPIPMLFYKYGGMIRKKYPVSL